MSTQYHIIMQIQYTKNLNPGKFELGTTLSYLKGSQFESIKSKNICVEEQNTFLVLTGFGIKMNKGLEQHVISTVW